VKYITVEQLLKRKQELILEREDKIKMLVIGYDNAIAIIEELINMAANQEEADDVPHGVA
jgi:ATP-dependent Clp protease ATP-binding subunit ClpA